LRLALAGYASGGFSRASFDRTISWLQDPVKARLKMMQ
jgi:hypothetical protein